MSEKWNIDYDSGFNSGMEFERERIIKVLIQNLGTDFDCDCDSCEDEKTLIAIIRGEQK